MDREKLKRIREDQKLTLKALSDDVGISISQLSRFESGEREPRVSEIKVIARRLNVAPAVFLQGGNHAVNVVGLIGADARIFPMIDQAIYGVETQIPAGDDMVGFSVDGNAMYPRYDAGDILICRSVAIDSIRQGGEAAVQLSDDRRYIKRLRRENGRWGLESHNADPIRDVEVVWVAKVSHLIRADEVQLVERTLRK